jgi:hypothetical protein
MKQFIRTDKGQLIRFALFSAVFFFFYYAGLFSLTLFLLFELLLLLRFFNLRKYLEVKFLSNYPAYTRLPDWAKWAVVLFVYLLIFLAFKWLLVNLVLEGFFHIPINEELQAMSNGIPGNDA